MKSMKKNLKLHFQKGDILAILLVAGIALGTGLIFRTAAGEKSGQAMVLVWMDGELIKEVPLHKDQTFEITGKYRNVAAIRDGKVAILESDCPGGDCVHSGWIDGTGRSIICLPNRVEIRIVGTEDEVDFVVG